MRLVTGHYLIVSSVNMRLVTYLMSNIIDFYCEAKLTKMSYG